MKTQSGFTLIELVAVLVLVAVLAVTVLPRMEGALALRGDAWRDQVVATLRQAQTIAVGHRRLVCVTVASSSLSVSIATSQPASSCATALPGPDGDARWARDVNAPATALSPAGSLFFQPSGRVTSDGAGLLAAPGRITISGQADVQVVAETGHVQ
jgi:MSHA pilin protein MshC